MNALEPLPARVLIVDDQLLYRDSMAAILSEQKYDFRAITNGADALRAIAEWAPDLVLLDIEMPGMNGFDVCKAIKAQDEWRSLPVVFFSWQDDSDSVIRGISLGACDFISKGMPRKELLARIQTHLRERQQRNHGSQKSDRRLHSLENQMRDWHRQLASLAVTVQPPTAAQQLSHLAEQMQSVLASDPRLPSSAAA